jgi:hypothetical protein
MMGSVVCMMLMLTAGVPGHCSTRCSCARRSSADHRHQGRRSSFGHSLKLVYFGLLIEQAGSVEPWFLVIAVVRR